MAHLTADDAAALERCRDGGGVVLFPSDTVYGLGCDPDDVGAAERLYELKGRPAEKPAAVMFFSLEPALELFAAAGDRVATAARGLLPGAVTLLIGNPQRRFLLASGPDPTTLGVRVPALPELATVTGPLLQTSANLSGEPDARRLEDVPESIRERVDLVLDGGELPGTPSTVIDLRCYEDQRKWTIVREGAVAASEVERILGR